MEKKNYQKPDMRVVMMEHRCYLLQDPNSGSQSRSYRMNDDE